MWDEDFGWRVGDGADGAGWSLAAAVGDVLQWERCEVGVGVDFGGKGDREGIAGRKNLGGVRGEQVDIGFPVEVRVGSSWVEQAGHSRWADDIDERVAELGGEVVGDRNVVDVLGSVVRDDDGERRIDVAVYARCRVNL